MSLRSYEVHALGHDEEDVRFDEDGMGYSFSTQLMATGIGDAEAQLRKDPYFRKVCRQNGEHWSEVPIVASECPADKFAPEIVQPRFPVMTREAFLRRTHSR